MLTKTDLLNLKYSTFNLIHFINILLLYYFINIIIFCGTLIYFYNNNVNVFAVMFDECNVSLVNNMIYLFFCQFGHFAKYLLLCSTQEAHTGLE